MGRKKKPIASILTLIACRRVGQGCEVFNLSHRLAMVLFSTFHADIAQKCAFLFALRAFIAVKNCIDAIRRRIKC